MTSRFELGETTRREGVHRPSPSTVIALLALIVALGGTSYAAFTLPKDSVGTQQLKKNAVASSKIRNGAVTAAKLQLRGLIVPSATNAGHASTADTAANATNATDASHAASAHTADTATQATTAGTADTANKANTAGFATTAGTANAVAAQEAWREVGTTSQPGFDDGCWGNYANGFNSAGFFRDSLGLVHLKGLVKNGCAFGLSLPGGAGPFFTLPAGYRPTAESLFIVLGSNAVFRVDVKPDGTIHPYDVTASLPSQGWISIDGITFRSASS